MSEGWSLRFELPGLPSLQTDTRYWRVRQQERKRWQRNVLWAAREASDRVDRHVIGLERARLRLTRHSTTRPDPDNLAMSFKAVVDGLVSCGVLKDDTHAVIGTPEYCWEKAKRGEGRITVEVWEVTGEEKNTCPTCGQVVG